MHLSPPGKIYQLVVTLVFEVLLAMQKLKSTQISVKTFVS